MNVSTEGFRVVSLVSMLVFAASSWAGEYFQDFTAFATGTTTFGDGSTLSSSTLGTVAAVQDATYKELALTASGTANVRSAFLLPDLDPGAPVYAFAARWNSQVVANFPNAADGFSFNFGPLAALNLAGSGYAQEDGYGIGLSLGVRTYIGNAPGFYLRANGTVLTNLPYAPGSQWGTNNAARHFFEVDWALDSGLTVRVDGATLIANMPTPGYVPQAGDRFVWAARCGSLTEEVRLDNLVVVTGGRSAKVPLGAPYFASATTAPAYPASNGFDGLATTQWEATNLPAFLGGKLGAKAQVMIYTVNDGNMSGPVSPAAFQLESSVDGTNWTSTGSHFGRFLNMYETRAYLGTSSPTSSLWRLLVYPNTSTVCAVGELGLEAFTPVVGGPPGLLATGATTNLNGTSLSGNVAANGFNTTVVIEWGATTSYGSSNSFALIAATVSNTFSVLAPTERARTLHYRVSAANAAGLVVGQVLPTPIRLIACTAVSGG